MAVTTAQKIIHDHPLPGLTLGAHGSPYYLLNSDATAANGADVESWTNDTNIHRVDAAGGKYRFLDVFLVLYHPAATAFATQPVIRAYGAMPNVGDAFTINKTVTAFVSSNVPDFPKDEIENGPQPLVPLIPTDYTNASTTTAVTFPSVSDVSLYSGATNDIKIFPPVSFFLNGASAVYTTVTTAGATLSGNDVAFLVGRFTS